MDRAARRARRTTCSSADSVMFIRTGYVQPNRESTRGPGGRRGEGLQCRQSRKRPMTGDVGASHIVGAIWRGAQDGRPSVVDQEMPPVFRGFWIQEVSVYVRHAGCNRFEPKMACLSPSANRYNAVLSSICEGCIGQRAPPPSTSGGGFAHIGRRPGMSAGLCPTSQQ